MGSMGEHHLAATHLETPLIESAALSRAAGCRIFLKLENLQPSGSFKSRGIGNLIRKQILASPPGTPHHFYSSSGGNAGLACVAAARTLGYPSTVIVPMSTKPHMIAKIRTAGASDVIQTGETWREADTYLRETVLAKDPNGAYVPPFDHEDVWEGNATMVEEIKRQLGGERPQAILCAVGGGGLFCGVMKGLEREYESGSRQVRVLAVETEGAASLHASIVAGDLVTLPCIKSMATSLGATRVAAQALREARQGDVQSVVVSDAEAAMGCWRLADDEKLLVEAACGAPVALCYGGRMKKLIPGLGKENKVVVIVCGGSIVTLEMLAGWRKEYGADARVRMGDEEVPSAVTAP